ncbi:MAG: IS256 family transposase, partial [Clostridia bacterium]|nr:IS256 family transposase [Clostridia bacterium]
MAKKNEVPGRKELIKQLLASYEPKDAKDVQDLLKDMFKDTLQEMLNAELDNELGYSKYNYKEKETDNSRNGYSKKTVRSTLGDIELDIPRDRKGEFEPEIVKKNQKNVTGIEDQIISMYAKGMSTRDISSHLEDIYGIDASAEMISRITDKILPIAKEWQNRPLDRKYVLVYMDAVHYSVREENRIVKKAVYVAIGLRTNGMKEVLGMWIGGNESAKYWLGVMNELRNRGVEDVLIFSIDGLSGFGEAISIVYPNAEIQRCIVHQIRYTTKFVSYKDIKPFVADLKEIYQASTLEAAEAGL